MWLGSQDTANTTTTTTMTLKARLVRSRPLSAMEEGWWERRWQTMATQSRMMAQRGTAQEKTKKVMKTGATPYFSIPQQLQSATTFNLCTSSVGTFTSSITTQISVISSIVRDFVRQAVVCVLQTTVANLSVDMATRVQIVTQAVTQRKYWTILHAQSPKGQEEAAYLQAVKGTQTNRNEMSAKARFSSRQLVTVRMAGLPRMTQITRMLPAVPMTIIRPKMAGVIKVHKQ